MRRGAETYAQREARYKADIAGLKEALDFLENETALIQRKVLRRKGAAALRGKALVA